MDLKHSANESGKVKQTLSCGKSTAGLFLPWVCLLAGFLLTGFVWHGVWRDNYTRIQERFDFSTKRIEGDLRTRLLSYEHMLRGGLGLLRSLDSVSPEDWRVYVSSLDVDRYYPGCEGLGFAQYIPAAEKEAANARLRAAGFLNHPIRPEGQRSEYVPMVCMAPLTSRKRRVIGFDMFSEPVRREALIRARDSGQTAMSGKIIPVVNDDRNEQSGVQIYLPFYRKGLPLQTVAERRAALAGYVSCPLRMTDFMRLLTPDNEQVSVAIYDSGAEDESHLLYQGGTQTAEGLTPDYLPRINSRINFEFGGHSWLLVFSSTPEFEAGQDHSKEKLTLFFGVLISLLLARWIFIVIQSKRLAAELSSLSIEQEASNRQLMREVAVRQAAEASLSERARELDAFNAAMIGRENRVIELKEEVNRYCDEQGREPVYPPVWDEPGKNEG